MGFVIITLVASAITLTYLLNEIDHMLGGNTKEVDFEQFKRLTGPIAITNTHVLSTDSTTMLPDQTILIEAGNIIYVGKEPGNLSGFTQVDAKGKYVIPGLIDTHIHIKKSKNDLLLYLANGITHIAEMTGMDHHFAYQNAIQNGMIGPDIFIASPKVASQQGIMPKLRSWFERRHQQFLTPEAIRQAVKDYQDDGFQAIKVSSDLSKSLYFALNEEAQKRGIPVIGHLPIGLTLDDLFRSGQSQLAHIDSILYAIHAESGLISSDDPQAYLDYINTHVDAIAAKIKQHKITLASTLYLHSTLIDQGLDLANFLTTIPLEYQNPGWVEGSIFSRGWLPGNNSYEYTNKDPKKRKNYAIYRQTRLKAMLILTKALVENGVMITVGTDAHAAAGIIPGFSFHKELQTLSQAGLSQTQIINSATQLPAQWLGANTGKIAKDHQADLVLLNHNPLEDISHTTSIHGVMSNGQYFDRVQLDNMLLAVKRVNNDSRKTSISRYIKP